MSKLINQIREYKIKFEEFTRIINEKDIQIKTLLSRLSKLENQSDESLTQKDDIKNSGRKKIYS